MLFLRALPTTRSLAKCSIAVTRSLSSVQNPFSLSVGELVPGIHASEFQARRARAFDLMPTDSLLILNAAEEKYSAHDIPYDFRQDSQFLYLTGLEEPEAIAILKKDGSNATSFIMFVRPRDSHSEQWDGPRVHTNSAKSSYLADEAFTIDEFESVLPKLVSASTQICITRAVQDKYSARFINATRQLQASHSFQMADNLLDMLRVIKSPVEIEKMRHACNIGSAAFQNLMSKAHPGQLEIGLAGTFEGYCRGQGSLRNAFPCVVGAGANASVIHYLAKRGVLKPDELVLMDSGCEVTGNYVSDITRTFPTTGRFTKPQHDLYSLILDVQLKCIERLSAAMQKKERLTLDELHIYSVGLLADGMQEFGILPRHLVKGTAAFEHAFRKYNPTHLGHYLGMDVHDTPTYSRSHPIVPGMIITIEPGIYLPSNDDAIPHEYRGIGIRIEDDVLITESGIEILTKTVPKSIADLENFIGKAILSLSISESAAMAMTRVFSRHMSTARRAVVVDGVRMPFAKSSTLYEDLMAYDLMRDSIKGLLNKTALDPASVDYVICGTVIQEVRTSNIAREAALGAGIPKEIPAHTVTQACISSSQAIAAASEKIMAGSMDIIIAGGVETFSDVPIRFARPLRKRMLGAGKAMKGGPGGILKLLKGLKPADFTPEAPAIKNFHTNEVMGNSSDRLAARFGVTRKEMDEYSVQSHLNAAKAHAEGKYEGEILPFKGSTAENGINLNTSIEKLTSLKPAFVKPHGTHTAGNSSFLTDGSAATLLMSESKALELGYKPKSIILDSTFVGVDPFDSLLLGPAYGIAKVLKKHNLKLSDIDHFEIHEAFAGQVLANLKALNDADFCKQEFGWDGAVGRVDMSKLNTWGGSLALGHPFGATGSRLVNTASNKLVKEGGKYAILAACADSGLAYVGLLQRYEA
ncbi:trifunctional enzyme subunit beta, mitochondrial precursor [Thraustotheca clavata]|uniref:Trifunctional enzyme subunit beta, mitochondrial n=1 Tax=Thraustotheca clavata TaxID=74557 RepID=A0A1W0A9W8_9STRA|nr:trifunctional enzyme subunit beta, mitochondrial precursor [Thraustotheca clavata]